MFVEGDLKSCCHCRRHSVGLEPGPSPANVTLQVALRQSRCFPQHFPPCWESCTAPDGFPAAPEGPALGWLWHTVLGAGCTSRGQTGSTAPCWNPAGIGNSSPGGTGNTRIHQPVLALGWPAALSSWDTASPCCRLLSASLQGTRPPGGKGNLEKPVPIPKNCPEHPRPATGEIPPGRGLVFQQHNGICNCHALTALRHGHSSSRVSPRAHPSPHPTGTVFWQAISPSLPCPPTSSWHLLIPRRCPGIAVSPR